MATAGVVMEEVMAAGVAVAGAAGIKWIGMNWSSKLGQG
jgi:hypothetical protein